MKHPSCVLFVLLAVMHWCSSSTARSLGNETDRTTLIDIKLRLTDPNGILNSWNDSQHHCQWPGVSCDMRHRRVTALALIGRSLSGTISPCIGNLSFIKTIHLMENRLHGEIPQQIGHLSRLRFFNLTDNLLSGEIPFNLSRCTKLRYLTLSKNYLTGSIPAQFGSLTNLEILHIDDTNLTGKIPASLGNLSSSLTKLLMTFNNFEGYVPDELGSLSRLRYLELGANKLRGEIPSSLFNITTLTRLYLPGNLLHGKLPTNIFSNLPNLEELEISANYFSGEISVSISNCTNLKRISLGQNQFEGKVPPSVGQLLNLHELILEKNSLQGNVLEFLVPLVNCTNLSVLALSGNNLSGELSSTIGNMSSQLYELYLSHNKISGTIPMELGNLVGLVVLSFGNNSLSGVIPANLEKLQNLRSLSLSLNGLSGQISPTFCSNMTNLYGLWLNTNNLEGDISHSFANCKSLQLLRINGNKLSGSFPSRISGSYLSPIMFYLSNNSFSGSLPLEIGKLANLQELHISLNKLSGPIPLTIGDCSVMRVLDLHNNQFSGPLPPSLASLKGIEYLDLSDNALTGPILGALKNLVFLTYLNMSYNNLEGEVPTDGVFANASQIMLQGNSKLCGGISELGLPACPVVHRKTRGKKHLKIIIIPLISTLVISITLFLYLFLRKKRSILRTRMPSVPSEKMLRVSYHDLYRATGEFSPANLIGSGSFGFVYKGSLVVDDGEVKVVAVKVLDLQKKGAFKSFKAECKALSNLRHRNLVPMLTYCSSINHKGDEFKALVYKYMENGSLDTWLHPDHSHEPPRCLNLLQRLNIAIDVASALDHLHNHSHTSVAHCDVKPSNILLDNELTAYVGDFGLSRLMPQLQQGPSSSTLAIKAKTIFRIKVEVGHGLTTAFKKSIFQPTLLISNSTKQSLN